MGALAQQLLRERQARHAHIPSAFLGEPVWDMLLDLFVADEAGTKVCVGSACLASGVPSTTALRHIKSMERAGLVERHANPNDKRTRYLKLSAAGREMMVSLLRSLAGSLEGPDRRVVPAGDAAQQD